MRKFILFLFLLSSHSVKAQFPGWQWAKAFNGNGYDHSESSATDHSGNLLTVGVFRDTMDFDPGVGTYNLACAGNYDIFVSKLDSNGNFLWAHGFGGLSGDWGIAVAVDSDDNSYVTGNFSGTIDFDPGPGTFLLTGTSSIYVLKFDPNGNFIWAVSFGQAPSWGIGNSILTDSDQNIYVTGTFSGIMDFDPGPGMFNMTGAAAGPFSTFMLKLDSASNFIWAKKMTGVMHQYGNAPVALDASCNTYFIGYFSGTLDFDQGAGIYNLTSLGSNDAFITKTDSSGNFVWTKKFGGSGNEIGYSVALDSLGDVYAYGEFSGTTDFDPGPATFNLNSGGYEDAFITKLNTNGDLIWAGSTGSNNSPMHPFALTADLNGNIYMAGYFTDTVDFDPGPAVVNLIAGNNISMYLIKVDSTGNMEWGYVEIFGGALARVDISLDESGNGYITGSFALDSIVFSPFTLYNAAPLTGLDIYLAKFATDLTAIPGSIENNTFSIFPNPVNDMLSFDSKNSVREAIITDASGREVENIICPQGVIDVKHLANGVYFISLHFSDKKVFTRKFVKQ